MQYFLLLPKLIKRWTQKTVKSSTCSYQMTLLYTYMFVNHFVAQKNVLPIHTYS